jgi:hypothetical protein
MEFEMCFSNVFSLAPEINDFFRCLRGFGTSPPVEKATVQQSGPRF